MLRLNFRANIVVSAETTGRDGPDTPVAKVEAACAHFCQLGGLLLEKGTPKNAFDLLLETRRMAEPLVQQTLLDDVNQQQPDGGPFGQKVVNLLAKLLHVDAV